MGSTTVDFRGAKFEASDGALEVWLHFLVVEIDKLPQTDPWLREVRQDWELQSTAGFGFGVFPSLDRFVTTEEQRQTILRLSESALYALEQQGKVFGADKLNALNLGGEGSFYTKDVPTEMFLRVGWYFVKLLQGTLSTAEGDARIYNGQ